MLCAQLEHVPINEVTARTATWFAGWPSFLNSLRGARGAGASKGQFKGLSALIRMVATNVPVRTMRATRGHALHAGGRLAKQCRATAADRGVGGHQNHAAAALLLFHNPV